MTPALHRPSTGGTPGTTRSRKTPHRGAQEVGFLGGPAERASECRIAPVPTPFAVFVPDHARGAQRHVRSAVPPVQGAADPGATSQIQRQRAGTGRGADYTIYLVTRRAREAGRREIDPAGSTLALQVSGPKNGVHLTEHWRTR